MRLHLRIHFVLFACVVTLGAHAQDPARCADSERRHGAHTLQMLGFLNEAGCLGGEKDSDPVAIVVRERLSSVTAAAGNRDAVPNVTPDTVATVVNYVTGEIPNHAQAERDLLAAVAREIEAVRVQVSANVALEDRDAKGWEWDGERKLFLGLPVLGVARLDVNCPPSPVEVCERAGAAGKVVFRAAALVKQSLDVRNLEVHQRALDLARARDKKWTQYFDDARLQFPWELYANGLRYARENRKAGGFADVPKDQWILLHPGVGLEYVRHAPRGSRFEPALVVEIVGYNRWSWKRDGSMGTAIGASLIQTYSDRMGLKSSRPGVMLHYNHKYSLAVTRGNGETGLMLSMDLSRLVTRVEDEARSKFRQLGTKLGAD